MLKKFLLVIALLAGIIVPAQGAAATSPIVPSYTFIAQATTNVYIRTGPSSSYSSVYLLQGGQYTYGYCYVVGQSVNGDSIWYYNKPNPNGSVGGYTAGYYLTTGADPKAGVPHC